jgi:hypothetical protein
MLHFMMHIARKPFMQRGWKGGGFRLETTKRSRRHFASSDVQGSELLLALDPQTCHRAFDSV